MRKSWWRSLNISYGYIILMNANLTLEVLNDLIEINGLRIWNYQFIFERPNHETSAELCTLFSQMIDQGQHLQNELELQFVEIAHDLPPGGCSPGVILRVWAVVKSAFPHDGAMPLSEFLDKGERAVLKAYDYAVKLPDIIKTCHELIDEQRQELVSFYQQYRSLYKEDQQLMLLL